MYCVGLPDDDQAYLRSSAAAKTGALDTFTKLWVAIYGDVATIRPGMRLPGRGPETQFMENMGLFWEPGDMQTTIRRLTTAKGQGLAVSNIFWFNMQRLQCIYYAQSPPVWEDEQLIANNLSPGDLTALLGVRDEVPGKTGVPFSLLATRIRELYGTDLSPEALNERFEDFSGMSQLLMSTIILDDIDSFARGSERRTKIALDLVHTYKDDLVSDDLLRKRQILLELSDVVQTYMLGMKKGPARRLFGLMTARMRGAVTNVDEFLQFFTNVYDASPEFVLPALLLKEVVQPKKVVAEKTARALGVGVAREVRPSAPKPSPKVSERSGAAASTVQEAVAVDPQVLAKIRRRSEILQRQADKVLGPWRMQAKARKGRFGEMQRQLTGGCSNAVGERLALDKDHAQQTVDILARIHALATRPDATPEQVLAEIAKAKDQHAKFMTASSKLRNFARSSGATEEVTPPDILKVDIAPRLQVVAAKWSIIEQLIINTWPAYGGPAVVKLLKPLLGPTSTTR
jgi:hypothetical protein